MYNRLISDEIGWLQGYILTLEEHLENRVNWPVVYEDINSPYGHVVFYLTDTDDYLLKGKGKPNLRLIYPEEEKKSSKKGKKEIKSVDIHISLIEDIKHDTPLVLFVDPSITDTSSSSTKTSHRKKTTKTTKQSGTKQSATKPPKIVTSQAKKVSKSSDENNRDEDSNSDTKIIDIDNYPVSDSRPLTPQPTKEEDIKDNDDHSTYNVNQVRKQI